MKGIVRFLVRMLVLNIVLVPIMALGPLLYVIPFFWIAANPQDNFSGWRSFTSGSDRCRAHLGCWSRATGRHCMGRGWKVG